MCMWSSCGHTHIYSHTPKMQHVVTQDKTPRNTNHRMYVLTYSEEKEGTEYGNKWNAMGRTDFVA